MANPKMVQKCAKEQLLSAEYIRSIITYDPITGRLSRPAEWSGRGDPANSGSISTYGYRVLSFGTGRERLKIMAHRLAWISHYGEWPPDCIDHINGDRQDNRITNLRLATLTENARNRGKTSHNQSGTKGVTWDKSRSLWMARLNHEGKFINLGRFATREEAQAAYVARASLIHGEFFHL